MDINFTILRKQDWEINPNDEELTKILNSLIENNYTCISNCPKRIGHNQCPCTEYLKNDNCICRLYVKKKKNSKRQELINKLRNNIKTIEDGLKQYFVTIAITYTIINIVLLIVLLSSTGEL